MNFLTAALLAAPYFDVSTPYFAGKYELRHLPVPPNIASNVEYPYTRRAT